MRPDRDAQRSSWRLVLGPCRNAAREDGVDVLFGRREISATREQAVAHCDHMRPQRFEILRTEAALSQYSELSRSSRLQPIRKALEGIGLGEVFGVNDAGGGGEKKPSLFRNRESGSCDRVCPLGGDDEIIGCLPKREVDSRILGPGQAEQRRSGRRLVIRGDGEQLCTIARLPVQIL